ncbi:MAG: MarR family winged helix-turn-helix transcriptional regulator [Thermomicrobiales bacterium]
MIDGIVETLPEVVHLLKSSGAGICASLRANGVGGADGWDADLGALSLSQIKGLMFLRRTGRSPVGDVAAGLGVSIATASQMLDRMVDDGWADRAVNPDDRRQVLIRLTPNALEVADRIHAVRREQIRAALDELGPEEGASGLRLLQALARSLRQLPPPERTQP